MSLGSHLPHDMSSSGETLLTWHSASFFGHGRWMVTLFFVPLIHCQASEGVQASVARIRLLPAILAAVSGALCADLVLKRTGRYFWLAILGLLCMATGLSLICLFSRKLHGSIALVIAGMALCGLGNGLGVIAGLTDIGIYPSSPLSLVLLSIN